MTPTKTEFTELAQSANVIPVYAELLADMETPVSTFAKLDGLAECFLLESAENVDNWGRYSFIGCNPSAVFTLNGKKSVLRFSDSEEIKSESEVGMGPLAPLREYIAGRRPADVKGLPRFFGGLSDTSATNVLASLKNSPNQKERESGTTHALPCTTTSSYSTTFATPQKLSHAPIRTSSPRPRPHTTTRLQGLKSSQKYSSLRAP